MATQLQESNFSFYRSSVKQSKRDKICDLLHSFKDSKTVLTLGGLYAKDAKMFASQDAQVISIERERHIFEKQKKELRAFRKIIPLYGTLEDIVEQKLFIQSFNFDLVYLDYLGPYTKSKEITFSTLLSKNLLNKGSYFCLTLELAREDSKLLKGTVLESVTCQGDIARYFDKRQSIIEQALKDLGSKYGRKLVTVSIETYRNNEGDGGISPGTPPMLLLIMKLMN